MFTCCDQRLVSVERNTAPKEASNRAEALLLSAGGVEPTPGFCRGGAAVFKPQRLSRVQAGGDGPSNHARIALLHRREARRTRLRNLEAGGCRRMLRSMRPPPQTETLSKAHGGWGR